MFQCFDDIGGPHHVGERVAGLRAALAARDLDAVIVPHADEHQNEFIPASAERLLWLTGFSGSWGMAVVLRETAVLFVDGRYVLQAAAQTDTELFQILQVPAATLKGWLAENLSAGQRLGYDPRLHTIADVREIAKAAAKAGAELVAVDANPIDEIWTDRPKPPAAPVSLHPIELAGKSASAKLADLRETLRAAKEDACVLTTPESIAWLLNIRGADIAHVPVPLCFAIVPAAGRVALFIDPAKVGEGVAAALGEAAEILPPQTLQAHLERLGTEGARVRLDPSSCAQWFADRLRGAGARLSKDADPCVAPRAIKNEAEISGARAAHERDGVAMCRFLAWLDAHAQTGDVDEIGAARRLEAIRAETGVLRDISFDTISGAGPDGAIVHYRVTQATNRALLPGSLYLVDSGAQYPDGTTDITRTVAIGEPNDMMRRAFTLVLKGHIAIATARFPKGTRGIDLDPFARRPLWEAGFDYDHGTGHGVGSYLGVHEGPVSIARRGMAVIEPGMILSNEPGYYLAGEFGIRIENLVLVRPLEPVAGGDREMMSLETLSLAPIDLRLVDPALLSNSEREWLNAYHERVLDTLGDRLSDDEREWLTRATARLGD